MFKQILIPLDGSPLAEAILPQVRQLLKQEDAEVLLLRVLPPVLPEDVAYLPSLPERRAAAQAYLTKIEQDLIARGARARSLVEDGPDARTILDVAERESSSLIAMSTHGYTGLARWVFGSVTEKVIRASTRPVFVTRSFQEPRPIRNILVPIGDGDAVPPHAVEFAKLFDARITTLHVAPPHRPSTMKADVVVQGDPAQKILETPADLIAMSTHGRTGVTKWVLGSVTEKVLRHSTVPMLIVRSK